MCPGGFPRDPRTLGIDREMGVVLPAVSKTSRSEGAGVAFRSTRSLLAPPGRAIQSTAPSSIDPLSTSGGRNSSFSPFQLSGPPEMGGIHQAPSVGLDGGGPGIWWECGGPSPGGERVRGPPPGKGQTVQGPGLSPDQPGTPTRAHILGGAVMGESPGSGVIGPDHQVWNCLNLCVLDGSAISANPGVNPPSPSPPWLSVLWSSWPDPWRFCLSGPVTAR